MSAKSFYCRRSQSPLSSALCILLSFVILESAILTVILLPLLTSIQDHSFRTINICRPLLSRFYQS